MIISNISIVCCFIPFFLLLSRKMRQVHTYRILGIYWLFNGLVNCMNLDLFQSVRNEVLQQKLTFYYNMIDTPLILVAFACAASGLHRKYLLLTLLLFVAGESGIVCWKGYTAGTSNLIIGGGLTLILGASVAGLISYVQKMEHSSFENSMVFVYGALLFAYGSFLIIYLFTRLHGETEGSGRDSFLLYYISLLLSAAVTSLGLWSYGLRRRVAMTA